MSQDIILGINVIWPVGRRRGAEASAPRNGKTNQQDAKEACVFGGCQFGDSIENKFNNREKFECPHNPFSSEGKPSMEAIGD